MVVGSLEVHLRFEGCRSLKDKRSVVRPLVERLRRIHHVAAAEVGDNDLLNVATIGIASVGTNKVQVERTLEQALSSLEESGDVRIESVVREIA